MPRRGRVLLAAARLPARLRARPRDDGAGAGEDDLRSLGLLLTVITFRSLAWYGLLTFVPLWEVSHGPLEAVRELRCSGRCCWSAAIGTLAAGPIADRIGLRTVLLAANVVDLPR